MQHKYSLLEFESTKALWLHQSGDEATFYQERFAELIEAEVDRRMEAEADLRVERERQVGPISSSYGFVSSQSKIFTLL